LNLNLTGKRKMRKRIFPASHNTIHEQPYKKNRFLLLVESIEIQLPVLRRKKVPRLTKLSYLSYIPVCKLYAEETQ